MSGWLHSEEEVTSPVKVLRRAIEAAPAAIDDGVQRTTRAMHQVQEQALALQEQAASSELVLASVEQAKEYSNALVKFTERQVLPKVKDLQAVRFLLL
jgi:methyl-accepting chemotaxis protein